MEHTYLTETCQKTLAQKKSGWPGKCTLRRDVEERRRNLFGVASCRARRVGLRFCLRSGRRCRGGGFRISGVEPRVKGGKARLLGIVDAPFVFRGTYV